jgi:hypothetical protein
MIVGAQTAKSMDLCTCIPPLSAANPDDCRQASADAASNRTQSTPIPIAA